MLTTYKKIRGKGHAQHRRFDTQNTCSTWEIRNDMHPQASSLTINWGPTNELYCPEEDYMQNISKISVLPSKLSRREPFKILFCLSLVNLSYE